MTLFLPSQYSSIASYFATGRRPTRPGSNWHREERSDVAISRAERTGRGIATHALWALDPRAAVLQAMTGPPSVSLFSP